MVEMAREIYAVVEFEVELGIDYNGPDISDVQTLGEAKAKVLQAIMENAESGSSFTRLDVEYHEGEENAG